MFQINARYGSLVGSFLVNDVMYCWNFATGTAMMFPCVAGTPLFSTKMFEV